MIQYKQPFPHDDGSPASWQDNQDAASAKEMYDNSLKQAKQYIKMLTSISK